MFLSFYGGRWQTQGYNTTTYMLRNQIVTGASLNDHTCICISSMFHSHYWCIAKNVFFKFSIFKCMHGFECGFSSQHVFVYHYLKKKKRTWQKMESVKSSQIKGPIRPSDTEFQKVIGLCPSLCVIQAHTGVWGVRDGTLILVVQQPNILCCRVYR